MKKLLYYLLAIVVISACSGRKSDEFIIKGKFPVNLRAMFTCRKATTGSSKFSIQRLLKMGNSLSEVPSEHPICII